jgi:hypothetical protein
VSVRAGRQAPPLFRLGGSREELDETPGADTHDSLQALAINAPAQYQKLVPTNPAPRIPNPIQSHTDDAVPSVPGINPT